MATIFIENDDEGYLSWIRENPDGFVVNMRDWLDPTYLVLHRATAAIQSAGGVTSISLGGNCAS